MEDNNSNPFRPSTTTSPDIERAQELSEQIQPFAPDPVPRNLGFMMLSGLVVVIAGCLNWHLSPLFGFGPAYSLFIHLPVFSMLVGILSGFMDRRILLLQPLLFFFVAYVLHAIALGGFGDKFAILFWSMGIVSTFTMLVGCCLGGLLKAAFWR